MPRSWKGGDDSIYYGDIPFLIILRIRLLNCGGRGGGRMSLRSLSSLGRRNAVISGEGKLYFVFPRIVPAIFFFFISSIDRSSNLFIKISVKFYEIRSSTLFTHPRPK